MEAVLGREGWGLIATGSVGAVFGLGLRYFYFFLAMIMMIMMSSTSS